MRAFLMCLLLFCAVVQPQEIKRKITDYFESQTVKSFYEEWKKYRKPIENSLELILKETYGSDGMNVYVRRWSDPYKLTEGILVNDNMVNVLFKDLYLTQLPHLSNPEVSFALASNVLKVESRVNKMFIQAEYQLFRNLSDITYGAADLDPFKSSPFNLQQVQHYGEVTIVAEDCILEGLLVATLNGQSVHLGHDTLRFINCKFYVEISTPEMGSPPVIAPYFSPKQASDLAMLLVRPIREELVPKLQGGMYSYVNTSSMFGDMLPKFRKEQNSILKETAAYMTQLTRNANEKTLNKNGGVEKRKDLSIQWSDMYDGHSLDCKLVLKNMMITGLDSAYSAQNGAPIKSPHTKIVDTIRLSSVQIRGTLQFIEQSLSEEQYVFYGEIQDVTAYMMINLDDLPTRKSKPKKGALRNSKAAQKFEIAGWRNLDLHAPSVPLLSPHALISGVIMNELPYVLTQVLYRSFFDGTHDAGYDGNDEVTNIGSGDSQDTGLQNGVELDYGSGEADNSVDVRVTVEHEDDGNNDEGVQNEENGSQYNNEDAAENVGSSSDDQNVGRSRKGRHKTDRDPPYIVKNIPVYESNYHLYCPIDVEEDSPLEVEFRLFTRDSKDKYILLDENAEPVDPDEIVDLSNIPLKLITHGWWTTAEARSVAAIKDAYWDKGNFNMIAVDWRAMAGTYYCQAAANVNVVGKGISRFLEAVNEKYDVDGDVMHLIGHSLGAHVVGIAAAHTRFPISRVTGLDPAAPLFEYPLLLPADERIDASNADFVDIIHTCGSVIGFVMSIGHKDFFPNNGMSPQPGCEHHPYPVSCSHAMAFEYYIDTIRDGTVYPALRCATWGDFLKVKGECDHITYMGDGTDTIFNGNYFLVITPSKEDGLTN